MIYLKYKINSLILHNSGLLQLLFFLNSYAINFRVSFLKPETIDIRDLQNLVVSDFEFIRDWTFKDACRALTVV